MAGFGKFVGVKRLPERQSLGILNVMLISRKKRGKGVRSLAGLDFSWPRGGRAVQRMGVGWLASQVGDACVFGLPGVIKQL